MTPHALSAIPEDIYICSLPDDAQCFNDNALVIVEAGTLVPCQRTYALTATSGTACFGVRVGPSRRHLGQLVFDTAGCDSSSSLCLDVSLDSTGAMTLDVCSGKNSLASIKIASMNS